MSIDEYSNDRDFIAYYCDDMDLSKYAKYYYGRENYMWLKSELSGNVWFFDIMPHNFYKEWRWVN